MLDRIESKIFLFMLFSNACRSDNKSPISPINVTGAMTYLATAFTCDQTIRAFEILSFSPLLFFQLENPFFVKAGSALDKLKF